MKGKKVILMHTLGFIGMFISAYALTYVFGHLYFNINKMYMAALMTGIMGVINVIVMRGSYSSKRLKYVLFSVSILLIVLPFTFLRIQAFVGDKGFLRSMIPHHSSAILMCEEADIDDPEIEELCDEIVETQKEEISIMKEMLEE